MSNALSGNAHTHRGREGGADKEEKAAGADWFAFDGEKAGSLADTTTDVRTDVNKVIHAKAPQPHEEEDMDWSIPIEEEDLPKKAHIETKPEPPEPSLSAPEMFGFLLSAPVPRRMLALSKDLDDKRTAEWCEYNELEQLSGVIRDTYFQGIITQLAKTIPKFVERKSPKLRNVYIRQFRKKNVMGKTIQQVISHKSRMEPVRVALWKAEGALEKKISNIDAQMKFSRVQKEPEESIKKTWLPRRQWMEYLLNTVRTVQHEHVKPVLKKASS